MCLHAGGLFATMGGTFVEKHVPQSTFSSEPMAKPIWFRMSPWRALARLDHWRQTVSRPLGRRQSLDSLSLEALEDRTLLSAANAALGVAPMWFQAAHPSFTSPVSASVALAGPENDSQFEQWIVQFRANAVQ